MRAIDATCTKSRHDRSSPAPSAQAIAALIGDTWLTTTTSRSRDLVDEVGARRADPHAERGERLAAGRARTAGRRATRATARPARRATAGRRAPRSRARSTVRRSPPAGRTPRRSRGCARNGLAITRASAGILAASAAACCRPSSDNGGSRRPSRRPAAFASVRPCRTRRSITRRYPAPGGDDSSSLPFLRAPLVRAPRPRASSRSRARPLAIAGPGGVGRRARQQGPARPTRCCWCTGSTAPARAGTR